MVPVILEPDMPAGGLGRVGYHLLAARRGSGWLKMVPARVVLGAWR